MLVIPAALLKFKEVLASSSSVKLNFCHVAPGNWIPPLASAPLQGGSDLRWGRLPFRHEDDCGVAPWKDVALQAALRVVAKGSLAGVHGEQRRSPTRQHGWRNWNRSVLAGFGAVGSLCDAVMSKLATPQDASNPKPSLRLRSW